MGIKPTKNRVMILLEGTENGKFAETVSEGGIIIGAPNQETAHHMSDSFKDRWAIVLGVGTDCTTVIEGERVLISAGKWTEGYQDGSDFFWFTDEEHVICVDDEYLSSNGETKTYAPVM